MTTGVGFSKLPIRLLTPPEIVIIDLVNVEWKQ
jgi:predicted MPP superfamily phosphohydrolase